MLPFPLFRRRAPLPRMSIEHMLLLLETSENFLKALPELWNIREDARDIFLWLATVLGQLLRMERLGDEYGIAEPVIRYALANIMNFSKLRRVVRYRELINLPRYVIVYAILQPVIAIRSLQTCKDLHTLGILRVLHASKHLDLPFTFIADMRQIIPTYVQIDPALFIRQAQVPKLPGPRLYYNIERCLKCEEEEDGKKRCIALVEDNECIDPTVLEEGREASTPQTEIVFVEKVVEKREEAVSRRIVVAFSYSLSNLLSDDTLYRAYGQIV